MKNKNQIMKKNRYKPIHDHDGIYCSPFCGFGCKYKDYLDAKNKAQELIKKVKSIGWEIDIWENLGWHYAIKNRYMHLHNIDNKYYYCLISNRPNGYGGMEIWTDKKFFTDPNKAVQHAVIRVHMYYKSIKVVADSVKKIIGLNLE